MAAQSLSSNFPPADPHGPKCVGTTGPTQEGDGSTQENKKKKRSRDRTTHTGSCKSGGATAATTPTAESPCIPHFAPQAHWPHHCCYATTVVVTVTAPACRTIDRPPHTRPSCRPPQPRHCRRHPLPPHLGESAQRLSSAAAAARQSKRSHPGRLATHTRARTTERRRGRSAAGGC